MIASTWPELVQKREEGELFLERRVQLFSEPGKPSLGLKDDWKFSGLEGSGTRACPCSWGTPSGWWWAGHGVWDPGATEGSFLQGFWWIGFVG